jgi:hypothetical protein
MNEHNGEKDANREERKRYNKTAEVAEERKNEQ